jgi:hypothetical protein
MIGMGEDHLTINGREAQKGKKLTYNADWYLRGVDREGLDI